MIDLMEQLAEIQRTISARSYAQLKERMIDQAVQPTTDAKKARYVRTAVPSSAWREFSDGVPFSRQMTTVTWSEVSDATSYNVYAR